MRPALALALFLAAITASAATVDPLLKNLRIALRMGPDHVLLIGGELQGYMESEVVRSVKEEFPEDLRFVRQRPRVAPVDDMHFASPERLARFQFLPDTPWAPGDRWLLHTGSTQPVALVLEEVGFGFYCGGPDGWAIAVARYESPTKAHVVAGLRAEAYLAAPSRNRVHVSTAPMVPLGSGSLSASVSALLLKNARAIISQAGDQDLMREPFLSGSLPPGRLTAFRWTPARGQTLIFAEYRWLGAQGRDLVGAGGVLTKSPLAIVQGGAGKAEGNEGMEPFAWLNVWQIGGRSFALVYSRGLEIYEVSLLEVVPGKGLVETGLSCMEGC